MTFRIIILCLWFSGISQAQQYSAVKEVAPIIPREFRAAWVACVYNIDWPSRKGMGAGAQQAEMKAMLDRMSSMKMNAIIFQVRPNADAVYQSRLEHGAIGSVGPKGFRRGMIHWHIVSSRHMLEG